VGAVYAGLAGQEQNALVAYGRNPDGTLTFIGKFLSGGAGGHLNGGAGSDPLVAADSVLNVDNRYILQVNAGSNSISSYRVNDDYSLTLVSVVPSGGFGPNTIAERDEIVYVGNASRNGVFTGPADEVGNVTAFRLDKRTGVLSEIPGSTRNLVGRSTDLRIAPDGRSLVASVYNAGSQEIAPQSEVEELESFAIFAPGVLSPTPVSTATSTPLNDPAGRNLPSGFGFTIREVNGRQVVVVTEAREFLASGAPATLSQFQTGSVSTFSLSEFGILAPISLDVPTSTPIATGPMNTSTSTCWIAFDNTGSTFWIASTTSAVISTYRFHDTGTITLVDSRAAEGTPFNPAAANPVAGGSGFVDLVTSRDSKVLYQLLSAQGTINVYRIGPTSLTLVQQESQGLPPDNVEGLVYVQRGARHEDR
jgi:6-phosphogluconolactonase (cycloisomerase 2 family)